MNKLPAIFYAFTISGIHFTEQTYFQMANLAKMS
jgi:hypothetical protein